MRGISHLNASLIGGYSVTKTSENGVKSFNIWQNNNLIESFATKNEAIKWLNVRDIRVKPSKTSHYQGQTRVVHY